MKMVRYAKTGSILVGAALAVFGLVLMLFPTFSMLTINYVAGAIILFSGIVRIVGYFSKDLYALAFQFDLALGIFCIILGAMLLLHPTWLISLLPILIGLCVLINSLFAFQTAFDSKKFGLNYWWVLLILSLISAVMGVLLIANPFSGAKILTMLLGCTVFFAGAEQIFLSIYTIVVIKKKKEKADAIDVTDYTYTEREEQP